MVQLWGAPWCQEDLIVPSKSVGFQDLNRNEEKIKRGGQIQDLKTQLLISNCEILISFFSSFHQFYSDSQFPCMG